ncbi:carboxylesterase family protein [Staphylococcus argenteus]|uniref:carboxylesterase family protein n=1 Tax=Staphylococcus argenteus TaxID=985002 RepID=UPI001FBB5913|nr:carboxylesterase/lipase family protein [Staphylococcus argenteus]GJF59328.1 carboxylesterase/lipase family protein [Staphylococcus argenteus]GJF72852.1 carboxylesterase/lipase family protein [Staphylococcus argenteus]GJF85739.1 carboxylesterase/lipase family protein [Staphylococcus argenteus]
MKISTAGGQIYGITQDSLDIFLGIPYAEPPINNHRFKHSTLKTQWNEPIDATTNKPIPPQPENKLEDFFSSQTTNFTENEDCLYLNIWKQHNDKTNKPVIIYFYGGSFENGHGSAELYRPTHLVKNNDVIVITCNYRLGALGYLDWSYFNKDFHSNNGLSDQINVIKWVHLFIECFGGNPNNVTLMGQSAGSMSILTLMKLPEIEPYFHKVILLSGALRLDTLENARNKAMHFQKMMADYLDTDDVTTLTTDDILMLMSKFKQSRGPSKGLDLIYAPIKTDNMKHHFPTSKPILACYTKDEGDIYITSEQKKLSPQRFIDIMELNDIPLKYEDVQSARQQSEAITHCYFKQPIEQLLQQLNIQDPNAQLWFAEFAWHDNTSEHYRSAYHILDMIFWFGNLQILSAHQYPITNHLKFLSRQMQNDLANFAKAGKMPWPKYHNERRYFRTYQ